VERRPGRRIDGHDDRPAMTPGTFMLIVAGGVAIAAAIISLVYGLG
jgi:hypothetical protein